MIANNNCNRDWHARSAHDPAEAIRKTDLLVNGLDNGSGKLSGERKTCLDNKLVGKRRKHTDNSSAESGTAGPCPQ